MYNRYIPQNDGSYHRQQIQEPPRKNPPSPPQPAPPPPPVPAPCQNCPSNPRLKPTPTSSIGIGSFLRRLLPRDFDTEDLIVILLLLLIAGDSQEDQNSALLTLALYLFL